jgi:hypothetical protein
MRMAALLRVHHASVRQGHDPILNNDFEQREPTAENKVPGDSHLDRVFESSFSVSSITGTVRR